MNRDVLVLNRSFYAIQITDWKRAIDLLYQNHAQAVDINLLTYNFVDWVELSKLIDDNPKGFIHTPSLRIALPEVIRLMNYDKLPQQQVKFSRKNIYEHYANRCSYCGKTFKTNELSLDHIIPRARGGKTNWTNIALSCKACNVKKDCRTPEEAGMPLLVKPHKPRWTGITRSVVKIATLPVPPSWQRLLDDKYWSVETK